MRAYAEAYTDESIQIVAINTPKASAEELGHLLKYDSTHGRFPYNIRYGPDWIDLCGKKISLSDVRNPEGIERDDIDIVLECSGAFNTIEAASNHKYAKCVIVSAPCNGCNDTIILGVNQEKLLSTRHALKEVGKNRRDKDFPIVLSAGSCTTNCCAPIMYALNNAIGIEEGFVTTVHSYTSDQNLLDNRHTDRRRARTAATSIIPTSTGVGKLLGQVIPALRNNIGAAALRVPTTNVSLIDFKFEAKHRTSREDILEIMKIAEKAHPTIISVINEELVSIDFNHTSYSAIFDATQTEVINGKFCRIVAWYDNEWGFANRMLDIANIISLSNNQR